MTDHLTLLGDYAETAADVAERVLTIAGATEQQRDDYWRHCQTTGCVVLDALVDVHEAAQTAKETR